MLKRKGSEGAKRLTKSQLMSELAAKTGQSKKDVEAVFTALSEVIGKELARVGEITALPGLLKIKKVYKKAKPARPGRNPATGEMMTFKAKPASTSVKCTALKGLKDKV